MAVRQAEHPGAGADARAYRGGPFRTPSSIQEGKRPSAHPIRPGEPPELAGALDEDPKGNA